MYCSKKKRQCGIRQYMYEMSRPHFPYTAQVRKRMVVFLKIHIIARLSAYVGVGTCHNLWSSEASKSIILDYQKKWTNKKKIKWLTPHNKTVSTKHTHLKRTQHINDRKGRTRYRIGRKHRIWYYRSKGKQGSYDKTCQLTLVEEATLFALTPFL